MDIDQVKDLLRGVWKIAEALKKIADQLEMLRSEGIVVWAGEESKEN